MCSDKSLSKRSKLSEILHWSKCAEVSFIKWMKFGNQFECTLYGKKYVDSLSRSVVNESQRPSLFTWHGQCGMVWSQADHLCKWCMEFVCDLFSHSQQARPGHELAVLLQQNPPTAEQFSLCGSNPKRQHFIKSGFINESADYLSGQ